MSAAGEKRSKALRAFFRKPRTLVCLALALLVVVAVIADCCIFPLRYASALTHMPQIAARGEGEMRIHFVDVGQGDCTIAEFPDGQTMMIDGGDGSLTARSAVLGYCFALGIETFDYVLLTHTDADHAAGLADVLACFGAETVFLPRTDFAESGSEDGDAYANFLSAAEECGAELCSAQTYAYALSEREETFWYFLFLSPLPQESYADANDSSAVLWLEYAGVSLLVTGDAPEARENALVRAFLETDGEAFSVPVSAYGKELVLAPALEELTLYKAGHHGSNSSSGEALLSLCTPETVVFSAGAGNSYEHPSANCIARVREILPDAELWRTDELGSIMVTVGADGDYTVCAVG